MDGNGSLRVCICLGMMSQVPSAWRDVVTDPSTFSSLFEFYKTTDPPRSSQVSQVVVEGGGPYDDDCLSLLISLYTPGVGWSLINSR